MSERQSKYNARRCLCHAGGAEHAHDSLKERDRCYVLQVRLERGEILDLHRQTRHRLEVNGRLIGHYTDDFSYCERQGEQWVPVTEDCKGVRTRDYVLRKKLFEALQGTAIRET